MNAEAAQAGWKELEMGGGGTPDVSPPSSPAAVQQPVFADGTTIASVLLCIGVLLPCLVSMYIANRRGVRSCSSARMVHARRRQAGSRTSSRSSPAGSMRRSSGSAGDAVDASHLEANLEVPSDGEAVDVDELDDQPLAPYPPQLGPEEPPFIAPSYLNHFADPWAPPGWGHALESEGVSKEGAEESPAVWVSKEGEEDGVAFDEDGYGMVRLDVLTAPRPQPPAPGSRFQPHAHETLLTPSPPTPSQAAPSCAAAPPMVEIASPPAEILASQAGASRRPPAALERARAARQRIIHARLTGSSTGSGTGAGAGAGLPPPRGVNGAGPDGAGQGGLGGGGSAGGVDGTGRTAEMAVGAADGGTGTGIRMGAGTVSVHTAAHSAVGIVGAASALHSEDYASGALEHIQLRRPRRVQHGAPRLTQALAMSPGAHSEPTPPS